MTDLLIKKKNETYLILEGEASVLRELSDIFTFYADGYKFSPKYRSKIWDGKIRLLRLLSQTRGETYYGLLKSIIDFCNSREYTFELSEDLKIKNKPSIELLENYTRSLNIGYKNEKITLRDYQVKGFIDSIQNKRNLLLSVTSSGKSAVIYSIVKYLTDNNLKGLVIVPNVSLIHQLHNDFIEYSCFNNWDYENMIHKIYSGQEKTSDKLCQISTWQSLMKIKQNSFFELFDYIIVDECFSGETKILTKNGYVEIKNIKRGDIVINYDQKNKIFKEDVVEKLHKNITTNEKMYELEFDNNKKIKVTGNHKFLTNDGWVRADNLTENHEVICYE